MRPYAAKHTGDSAAPSTSYDYPSTVYTPTIPSTTIPSTSDTFYGYTGFVGDKVNMDMYAPDNAIHTFSGYVATNYEAAAPSNVTDDNMVSPTVTCDNKVLPTVTYDSMVVAAVTYDDAIPTAANHSTGSVRKQPASKAIKDLPLPKVPPAKDKVKLINHYMEKVIEMNKKIEKLQKNPTDQVPETQAATASERHLRAPQESLPYVPTPISHLQKMKQAKEKKEKERLEKEKKKKEEKRKRKSSDVKREPDLLDILFEADDASPSTKKLKPVKEEVDSDIEVISVKKPRKAVERPPLTSSPSPTDSDLKQIKLKEIAQRLAMPNFEWTLPVVLVVVYLIAGAFSKSDVGQRRGGERIPPRTATTANFHAARRDYNKRMARQAIIPRKNISASQQLVRRHVQADQERERATSLAQKSAQVSSTQAPVSLAQKSAQVSSTQAPVSLAQKSAQVSSTQAPVSLAQKSAQVSSTQAPVSLAQKSAQVSSTQAPVSLAQKSAQVSSTQAPVSLAQKSAQVSSTQAPVSLAQKSAQVSSTQAPVSLAQKSAQVSSTQAPVSLAQKSAQVSSTQAPVSLVQKSAQVSSTQAPVAMTEGEKIAMLSKGRTSAASLSKGDVRRSHTDSPTQQKAGPSRLAAVKPKLLDPFDNKIPLNVRLTYLDKIFQHYIKLLSREEALANAEEDEKAIKDKSHTKQGYQVAAVNALKRLRDAAAQTDGTPKHSLQKVSHAAVLAGRNGANVTVGVRKSRDVSSPPKDTIHQALLKYCLTEEQLLSNGYPRWTDGKKKTVEIQQNEMDKSKGRKSFASISDLSRVCSRCNKEFFLKKKGEVVRDDCIYHFQRQFKRKTRLGWVSQFQCCEGDLTSAGCAVAYAHVFDTLLLSDLSSFIETPQPNGKDDARNKKVYALDCEMVYTTWGPALARLSVVDVKDDLVLDVIVKPPHHVIDPNTRFSGLKLEDLEGSNCSLEEARERFFELANSDTVLIGHSLESDLKAMRVVHHRVVDTSVVYPHRSGPPYKRALRNLAGEILLKIIQEDVSGHDSKEDASACMQLMLHKLKQDNVI